VSVYVGVLTGGPPEAPSHIIMLYDVYYTPSSVTNMPYWQYMEV